MPVSNAPQRGSAIVRLQVILPNLLLPAQRELRQDDQLRVVRSFE